MDTNKPTLGKIPKLKISDIKIICDSREGKNHSYQSLFEEMGFSTIIGTLSTGDYSLDFMKNQISAERKSINDLAQSLVNTNRERFFKEIVRLRGFKFRYLIIESESGQISSNCYKSRVHSNAILGSLARIAMDVNIIFGVSRKEAAYMLGKIFFFHAQDAYRIATSSIFSIPELSKKIVVP